MIPKIFRTLFNREEIKLNDAEDLLVEVDGVEMSVSKLIEDRKASTLKINSLEDPNRGYDVGDGKTMTVNELIDHFKGCKKNTDTPDEQKPADEADPLANAAEDDEKAKKEKEEKEAAEKAENDKKAEEEKAAKEKADAEKAENARRNARFSSLQDAHENGIDTSVPQVLTQADRVDLGKRRFGSGK